VGEAPKADAIFTTLFQRKRFWAYFGPNFCLKTRFLKSKVLIHPQGLRPGSFAPPNLCADEYFSLLFYCLKIFYVEIVTSKMSLAA